MAQVLREHVHGRAVGLHLLLRRHVDLAGRREQALVGVRDREAQLFGPAAPDNLLDAREDRFGIHHELAPQDALLLPAADGEVAVAGNLGDRLLEVVVLLELRGLGRLGGDDLALHDGLLREGLAHETAHLRHVGDTLREDVARALQILC